MRLHAALQYQCAHVMQVLNRILEHMKVGQDEPYTQDLLHKVEGYNGGYSIELSRGEQDAVKELRLTLDKPLRDLDKLLTVMGMDELFPGLPTEI